MTSAGSPSDMQMMDLTPESNIRVARSGKGNAANKASKKAAGSSSEESPAPTNWSTDKKFAEEYENITTRLGDQKFDPKSLPDPLVPRPKKVIFPAGSDETTEKALTDIIAQHRAPSLH